MLRSKCVSWMCANLHVRVCVCVCVSQACNASLYLQILLSIPQHLRIRMRAECLSEGDPKPENLLQKFSQSQLIDVLHVIIERTCTENRSQSFFVLPQLWNHLPSCGFLAQ